MSVLYIVAGAFALGGAFILCVSLLASGRKSAAELWPFYRSEFLIVGCLLLPAAAGKWPFLLLLLAMSGRGQYELADLFDQTPPAPVHVLAILAGLVLVTVGSVLPAGLPLAFAVAVGAVLAAGFLLDRSPVSVRAWLAAASLAFPVLLVSLLGMMRAQGNGFLWLFLAQATVEMNDSFALLIGKAAGQRRPLPRLSPGKTLAGFAGGLVVGGATGLVIARTLLGLSPIAAGSAVAAILIAGIAGDLLVSALKRWRRRKDFRPLANRHGGLLDIYDSLLFSAPAVLLLRAAGGF